MSFAIARMASSRTPTRLSAFRMTSWPYCRMLSHLHELFGRERAGFVEDVIGNADLADVVKRREARQQIDAFRRQVLVEFGMSGELLGEEPDVLLGSARMTAGLGVPGLGQRQQRLHHQALRVGFLASGRVGPPALDGELARAVMTARVAHYARSSGTAARRTRRSSRAATRPHTTAPRRRCRLPSTPARVRPFSPPATRPRGPGQGRPVLRESFRARIR